jgi:hypothetical protein
VLEGEKDFQFGSPKCLPEHKIGDIDEEMKVLDKDHRFEKEMMNMSCIALEDWEVEFHWEGFSTTVEDHDIKDMWHQPGIVDWYIDCSI